MVAKIKQLEFWVLIRNHAFKKLACKLCQEFLKVLVWLKWSVEQVLNRKQKNISYISMLVYKMVSYFVLPLIKSQVHFLMWGHEYWVQRRYARLNILSKDSRLYLHFLLVLGFVIPILANIKWYLFLMICLTMLEYSIPQIAKKVSWPHQANLFVLWLLKSLEISWISRLLNFDILREKWQSMKNHIALLLLNQIIKCTVNLKRNSSLKIIIAVWTQKN